MDEFRLNDFLPYQLAVLASRVSRDFARIYEVEFGLSVAEWRVIAHLGEGGEVSVREIHARVDMDKSRVSRAAARLEAAGLLAKSVNTADRRLVSLSLTPAGHDMLAAIAPRARAYEADLLARLPAEEKRMLRACVQAMLNTV
ncbi:MAG: DNA-binding MarR family transcriptional regulator [Paracoccaceae bacterium]|jgi:DNA-binding MarR family transcriptional regulator